MKFEEKIYKSNKLKKSLRFTAVVDHRIVVVDHRIVVVAVVIISQKICLF